MIKLIVLDIDGTFYPLTNHAKKNFENGVYFLSKKNNISLNDARNILLSYGVLPYANSNNKSITAFILEQGIDINEWNQYRNKLFSLAEVEKESCVDPQSILKLSKKFSLVALSSNSYENINKVFDYIGIKNSWFSDIICSGRQNNKVFDKREEIENLSNKYSIDYCEMISIGDRYGTDIEPMIKLGGEGILISSPKALEEVIDLLIKGVRLSDNDRYTIYYSK